MSTCNCGYSLLVVKIGKHGVWLACPRCDQDELNKAFPRPTERKAL